MTDTPPEAFPDWVLERLEEVEILEGEDGRALAAVAERLREIPGLAACDLLHLLSFIDGRRTVGEVVEKAASLVREDCLEVLWALLGRALRRVGGGSPGNLRQELVRLPRELRLPRRRRRRDSALGSVAVLGGGTAGYLAALALRRKLPDLKVTVIESPNVPVIGVGEATTPLLPAFLHGTLGLDIFDFFEEVRPTFKLGIRFLWGKPAPYAFNYPFAAGLLEDAMAHDGSPNGYCLPSLLMSAGRGPLIRLEDGGLAWTPEPFAYHVDNRRLVTYLRKAAEIAGIYRRQLHIVSAELEERGDPDGATVAALITGDGERLAYDFFIDASGFSSLLLRKELGSPFHSFSSSLPTDSALVFETPRGGPLAPYTSAETLDAGWAWSLPQREKDHRGYVFSSAHVSPQEAHDEIRRRFPDLQEPRLLRFRCGRQALAFKANVFALGNAYGFVEPLESTALHMVVVALHLLLRQFPAAPWEPANRRRLNEHLGGFWDQLRDFLALHFRFNTRLDTPFWRDCRSLVDLGGGEEALAFYRQRGNLSSSPHLYRFDSLWGDFGRDLILRGQGVPAPPPRPHLSPDAWRRLQGRTRALVEAALPAEEALGIAARRPELLRRLQARAPWLQDAAVGGLSRW